MAALTRAEAPWNPQGLSLFAIAGDRNYVQKSDSGFQGFALEDRRSRDPKPFGVKDVPHWRRILLRLVCRLLAYICLSLAIIAAVLDAARSVGASNLVITSLRDSWQSVSTDSFALVETSIRTHLYSIFWDPLMLWVLEAPTVVVFAFLALLLYAVGYRRADRAGRFAAR